MVYNGLYKYQLYPDAVNDISLEGAKNIFPNPANNFVEITQDNLQSIIIYDLAGREVIKSLKAKIDVSSLASGEYVIVINADNKKTYSKFLKE